MRDPVTLMDTDDALPWPLPRLTPTERIDECVELIAHELTQIRSAQACGGTLSDKKRACLLAYIPHIQRIVS